MRISDWSSDVCSSDLVPSGRPRHRDGTADQAIAGKTDCKPQRDPGYRARLPAKYADAYRRERHGDSARHGQMLTQHHHRQDHVEQRIDEIAEAGFQHMVVDHGDDIRSEEHTSELTSL